MGVGQEHLSEHLHSPLSSCIVIPVLHQLNLLDSVTQRNQQPKLMFNIIHRENLVKTKKKHF